MKYSNRILSVVVTLSSLSSIDAFTSLSSSRSNGSLNQVSSRFMGRTMTFQPNYKVKKVNSNRRGNVGMFLGSDGGILGVGTPEIITILLVGYFVLGPTELFKLTKEIGKFIQNFRTLGTEATKSFESTMENQVDLQEMRKAQSELTKAFDFRRSINVDSEGDAFSELPPIALNGETGAAAAGAAAVATASTTPAAAAALTNEAPKKRKKRRVKKKVQVEEEPMAGTGDIPDLDMSDAFPDLEMSSAFQDEFREGMGVGKADETEATMAARLRKERMERLEAAQARSEAQTQSTGQAADQNTASESDIASEILAQQPSPAEAASAQDRFQAQLSGTWNDQVLDNQDALSPLSRVMELIAILEEEKLATNIRIDEEFSRRAELEEKFYEEKRALLEQAAGEVSEAAYGSFKV